MHWLCYVRDHSGQWCSQWATMLHCNVISHWLSPCPSYPCYVTNKSFCIFNKRVSKQLERKKEICEIIVWHKYSQIFAYHGHFSFPFSVVVRSCVDHVLRLNRTSSQISQCIKHPKMHHFVIEMKCAHFHYKMVHRVLHPPVGAATEWAIVRRFSDRLASRKWVIESETKF